MREMLQLRTWLVGSEPQLIWRQFVVDPRLTLEQLHEVLQIAFGWEDEHLHQFHEKDGKRYGRPTEFDREMIDERKALLGKVFTRVKKKILYEYDFGDSWMHAVQLEKKVDGENLEHAAETVDADAVDPSAKDRAAICITGARNGPPEDCGGMGGYFQILALKKNPKAARYDWQLEQLEWLGDWDPDRFVLAEINRRLRHIRVENPSGG